MSDVPTRRQLDLAIDISHRVFTFVLNMEGYALNLRHNDRFQFSRMRLSFEDKPSDKFIEDLSIVILYCHNDIRSVFDTMRIEYLENMLQDPLVFIQYIRDYAELNFNGDKLSDEFLLYFIFTVDLIIHCNELGCQNLIPYALWETEETIKKAVEVYGLQEFDIVKLCEQIIEECIG